MLSGVLSPSAGRLSEDSQIGNLRRKMALSGFELYMYTAHTTGNIVVSGCEEGDLGPLSGAYRLLAGWSLT